MRTDVETAAKRRYEGLKGAAKHGSLKEFVAEARWLGAGRRQPSGRPALVSN